jgi:hypothetical protein
MKGEEEEEEVETENVPGFGILVRLQKQGVCRIPHSL